MRIIFMGTPEFAVPSLEILIENHYNIVAIVTAPDKPAGRGKKLKHSAIKEIALEHKLPILQPEKLKNKDFLEELKSYKANLQVVVAFRMLPEVVWGMPPKGTFNLHASLLPKYRGAAPINWAIMNGEKETGLTTFFLDRKIDTGPLIFQEKEEILPEDTIGTMYEKLKQKGANLVLKTVKAIEENNAPQLPQDLEQKQPKAPKIFRETCEIDFSKTATEIHNFVRGLSPIPAAWIVLQEKTCKVYKTEVLENLEENPLLDKNIGEYWTDNKKKLYFKTGKGILSMKEIQMQGKKRMDINSFLAGNKL